MPTSSTRLLLDFDACAQRDSHHTEVFLHRRDRKFALTCEEQGTKPSASKWLDYINRFANTSEKSQQWDKWRAFWRKAKLGFMLGGSILGVISMLGLLFYDGGQRINVTVIIAFVAFQLSFALFTLFQSILGWQPWRMLLKKFNTDSHTNVANKLQPLMMASCAHAGGICFALAGLTTLLCMVLLQDLAFGWSTTLDTSTSAYHAFVSLLASPWAWLWPYAAPDEALVEATRFFRAGGNVDTLNPARWGQWWPFVFMLWTSYVLLVRLILFTLTQFLIDRKAKQLLFHHKAMQALTYRMQTPTINTGSDHNDASDMPDLSTKLALSPIPASNIVLMWAGAGDSQLPSIILKQSHFKAKVGGRMTLAEDQATLEQVAAELATMPTGAPTDAPSNTPSKVLNNAPNNALNNTSNDLRQNTKNHSVLLVTRSWEPPTGEVEDFVLKAKSLWPQSARLVLVPLATDHTREPDKHHVEQWLRFAQRIKSDFINVSLLPLSDTTHSLSEHTA